MKLIKTFLIGSAALALSACSMGGFQAKGQKASRERFSEELAKVDSSHVYSKATIKFSLVEKSSDYGNVNEKGTLKYSYSSENGWSLDAGQNISDAARTIEENVGMRVSEYMAGMPSASEGYKINYYTRPLGITVDMNTKASESGTSYSMSGSAYAEFDQYGYVVKGVSKYKYSYKVSAGGKTVSSSESADNEFTITYQ